MNIALPSDVFGLALVVLMLGIKHGLDADHLAAIDALTRYNVQARPRLARGAGVLFSLGRGLVVVAVALGVSTLAQAWRAPHWPESFGVWVSTGVLGLARHPANPAVFANPAPQVKR